MLSLWLHGFPLTFPSAPLPLSLAITSSFSIRCPALSERHHPLLWFSLAHVPIIPKASSLTRLSSEFRIHISSCVIRYLISKMSQNELIMLPPNLFSLPDYFSWLVVDHHSCIYLLSQNHVHFPVLFISLIKPYCLSPATLQMFSLYSTCVTTALICDLIVFHLILVIVWF